MALLTIVIAIVVPFDQARAKGFYTIAFKSEKERYKKEAKRVRATTFAIGNLEGQ